jgi:hypothetical protein
MKPSGVQLARAIVPPGRHTRTSSEAAFAWSGANIEPNTDVTASNDASGKGSASASSLAQVDLEALGRRPLPSALEQRRDVVDTDHRAAVPGSRDRRVAAPGCDVEHAPPCVEVGRVAELLGHEHDASRDDAEVAACPRDLLALFHCGEVWRGNRLSTCHFRAPFCGRRPAVCRIDRREHIEGRLAIGKAAVAATAAR